LRSRTFCDSTGESPDHFPSSVRHLHINDETMQFLSVCSLSFGIHIFDSGKQLQVGHKLQNHTTYLVYEVVLTEWEDCHMLVATDPLPRVISRFSSSSQCYIPLLMSTVYLHGYLVSWPSPYNAPNSSNNTPVRLAPSPATSKSSSCSPRCRRQHLQGWASPQPHRAGSRTAQSRTASSWVQSPQLSSSLAWKQRSFALR
jgi:hypothetical protein